MRKDIGQRWVTLLRSGKFRQARGGLHDRRTDSFCCLGVLCELAVADGVILPKHPSPGTNYSAYVNSTGLLPEAVRDWAGAKDYSPALAGDAAPSLAGLNDDGVSFDEIADLIEANVDVL